MNTPQPVHMYQAGTSRGINGTMALATIMCNMYPDQRVGAKGAEDAQLPAQEVTHDIEQRVDGQREPGREGQVRDRACPLAHHPVVPLPVAVSGADFALLAGACHKGRFGQQLGQCARVARSCRAATAAAGGTTGRRASFPGRQRPATGGNRTAWSRTTAGSPIPSAPGPRTAARTGRDDPRCR